MIEIISWKYHENIIVISWENVDFESYGRESIVTRPQKNKSIFHHIYHRNIIVLIVISPPCSFPLGSLPFPFSFTLRGGQSAWLGLEIISWKYHENIIVISWKDTAFQPYGRQWPDVWLKQATFHYNYCIKIKLLMPSRYFWLYL